MCIGFAGLLLPGGEPQPWTYVTRAPKDDDRIVDELIVEVTVSEDGKSLKLKLPNGFEKLQSELPLPGNTHIAVFDRTWKVFEHANDS